MMPAPRVTGHPWQVVRPRQPHRWGQSPQPQDLRRLQPLPALQPAGEGLASKRRTGVQVPVLGAGGGGTGRSQARAPQWTQILFICVHAGRSTAHLPVFPLRLPRESLPVPGPFSLTSPS